MNDLNEQAILLDSENDADAIFVKEAQQDLAAFEKLYDKYVQQVYRYLLSRVGNVAVAEDLTSTTFVAAIEQFPRYKHRGYFGAWLFAIAKRKAVDFYRKEKKQSTLQEQVNEAIFISDLIDAVIDSEQQKRLVELVQGLTESERELIRLRFVAELKFREMARLLGRSEAAVKKSFYRLLKRLKFELEVLDD